jgi:hypothetical protein
MRALGVRPPQVYPHDRDDWQWHHYLTAAISTAIGVGVLIGPLAMGVAAALGGSLASAATHLLVQVCLWASISMVAAL